METMAESMVMLIVYLFGLLLILTIAGLIGDLVSRIQRHTRRGIYRRYTKRFEDLK